MEILSNTPSAHQSACFPPIQLDFEAAASHCYGSCVILLLFPSYHNLGMFVSLPVMTNIAIVLMINSGVILIVFLQ